METHIAYSELLKIALDEITNIEMAICLREGIETVDFVDRVELSDDFNDNLTILSELFAVYEV